jgi:outer membrane protein TolC
MKPTIRSARALVAALVLGGLVTGIGLAQSAPSQSEIPGVQMPSPQPEPTIRGTPLPYPAYGTPAPDVEQMTPKKGVPQSISLVDAVRISVALSPVFANDNAQWAAIHAKYTSELQALYPGVSGSASVGKQFSRGTTSSGGGPQPTSAPSTGPTPAAVFGLGSPAPLSRATIVNEAATITINQLIFDGGRTVAAIRSAKEADIAGRATLLRDLQTLEIDVATAYYTVLEDNSTVTADAQLVHEFEVNEASVAAQIRNGAAPRSDIAAAQFQTAQARGNLVTAQGTAIGAQAAFATALGLDADAMVVPKALTGQPPAPNPSYAVSLKRALIMRPDFIAADYNVSSARENLRYAKLARFPILSAAASDGITRQFIDCFSEPGMDKRTSAAACPGPSSFTNDSSIGLQLSVPIYDQGQTNYNVAVAASQLDQAVANLNTTRLTIESNVRSGLATLISARASLVQARSELTSAQVSLDATQAQYRVGASTILNVVTAEANLTTAQSAYISALYGVYTAEENYLYAMGLSDVQL